MYIQELITEATTNTEKEQDQHSIIMTSIIHQQPLRLVTFAFWAHLIDSFLVKRNSVLILLDHVKP